MKAIVTVFKSEFHEREFVTRELLAKCQEVREVGDAVIFSPKPGALVEFLSILRFNKIAYGTHFDTREKDMVPK
jgi:hypothetical protein